MRLPDVTPEPGASAASNPATPVGKHGGMALVAGGDDMSVEAVLQSLSPTSVKSVISQAAADAVAEVRIPQNQIRRSVVTHRLPPSDHPPPQLQSRLAAAERAQHAAEDRARAVKLDALAASKAHDAERQRWQTHFTRVQRETEAVKTKVEAVKTEHASNLRELVKRNEDLAAVGEALERERETRARCEDRLRKAKNTERGFLEKLAASEDSLELALSTNAEHAAKAARRARKSAHDAATGAGDWDEAYKDVKEELDAVRETLRTVRGGSERSGGPSRRRGNQGDERGGCASRHGHRGARERGEGAASEADDDGERGGEGGEPAGHRGKFRRRARRSGSPLRRPRPSPSP